LEPTDRGERPHVVILGGGFGGLAAARALRRAPARVTLIDRSNHNVFQPLLYQVATAGLEAADVGYPLRTAFRRQANTEVLMAEATSIDPRSRTVALAGGDRIRYDFLIVATGSQPVYFGHADWRSHAPSLKSLRDGIEMRYRILAAFELAEQARDPAEQEAYLRFVVVGGGPTGVELAGSVAELARFALRRDFRHIDTTKARVTLLQSGPAILPTYPPSLRDKAMKQLASLGVEVRTSRHVQDVDERGVTAGGEYIPARTVLWAAGVRPTPIVRSLGAPLDGRGRVLVTPALNPPGLPDVYVIGDLAALAQGGRAVPGVAPAAMQEGRYAAREIARHLRGRPPRAFRYRDKGQLAVIGRSRAVGDLPGHVRLSGMAAWLVYAGVHLAYLAGFRNRVRTLLSWAWSYLTYSKGARLIPYERPEAPQPQPALRAAARRVEQPSAPH
jgi:NADH dehydrogenase